MAFPIVPEGITKLYKPGFIAGLLTTICVLVYDCTFAGSSPK